MATDTKEDGHVGQRFLHIKKRRVKMNRLALGTLRATNALKFVPCISCLVKTLVLQEGRFLAS